MLKALIEGEGDPERLADLAQGTARKKHAALVEALRGCVTQHHRSMLKLHLEMIDAIGSAVREVDGHVGKALEPMQACAQLLTTIPGVSDIVANVIIAEIGTDMSRFPTPGHLISWAGLCPRNDESAGKRRSTRDPKVRYVAKDQSRHRSLVLSPVQADLPPRSISSYQVSSRRQEGGHGRRGFDAPGRLLHAA